jgi:hypothetical protein
MWNQIKIESMWPLIVASDLGRSFLMSSHVRPGHVAKKPDLMATNHVDVVGMKQHL